MTLSKGIFEKQGWHLSHSVLHVFSIKHEILSLRLARFGKHAEGTALILSFLSVGGVLLRDQIPCMFQRK